jgi:hypothetical protein
MREYFFFPSVNVVNLEYTLQFDYSAGFGADNAVVASAFSQYVAGVKNILWASYKAPVPIPTQGFAPISTSTSTTTKNSGSSSLDSGVLVYSFIVGLICTSLGLF